MKLYLVLLKTYYRLLSIIAPAIAARSAFNLFQKARGRTRKSEQQLYNLAKHFQVPGSIEAIDCYEIGNPNGKVVFLVHGWESNAGSMTAIGEMLSNQGFRIISFNLPAHGTSKLKKANLVSCSTAFLSVIDYVRPSEPFSVVSHSFGSAVTTYALSKVNHKVDKLAFLTTPDRISDIFSNFSILIGLNKVSFNKFIELAEAILGEPVSAVNIHDKIKWVDYDELILIHDLFDKVISHSNSLKVHEEAGRSRFTTIIKVGHYRMLWDEKVLDQLSHYFSGKTEFFRKAS